MQTDDIITEAGTEVDSDMKPIEIPSASIEASPMLAAVLVNQLDKWITDCQLQADAFFERGMTISETSSLAMKVAYMNVKTLVENSIER